MKGSGEKSIPKSRNSSLFPLYFPSAGVSLRVWIWYQTGRHNWKCNEKTEAEIARGTLSLDSSLSAQNVREIAFVKSSRVSLESRSKVGIAITPLETGPVISVSWRVAKVE